MEDLYTIQPYIVPEWAKRLKHQPKHKVKLSNLRTPIHRWHLNNIPEGFTVHIKRDDLTSAELSGNKVRSLEMFFAEAISEGCKHVVTGGGLHSGHSRAVALTARALGLVPHIVVTVEKSCDVVSVGETLLYRLAGSHLYLAPYANFASFQARVSKMQNCIADKYQQSCYKIPLGASSVLGIYGSLSAFDELKSQGVLENFDDIVVTIGTGGTTIGLAVGNYLTGSKLRIHAVNVALPRESLLIHCNRFIQELGLTGVKAEDILDIIEGYIGEGYGTATEEVLDFITATSSTTGGVFGLFSGEMDRVLNKEGTVTNNMTAWPDINVLPL